MRDAVVRGVRPQRLLCRCNWYMRGARPHQGARADERARARLKGEANNEEYSQHSYSFRAYKHPNQTANQRPSRSQQGKIVFTTTSYFHG